MDVNNQPESEGKEKGAPGNVNLEEQNRGLMQGMMAEREKRQALEREVSELKGRMETLNKQQTAPKQYTRHELEQLIDDGKLDRSKADQIMDAQIEARVRQSVTDDVRAEMVTRSRDDRVAAELDRYVASIPDVATPGTDARRRVEQEFQYLTSLGDAPNKATELKALRAVFGPADGLQKSEPSRETHQEAGEDTGGEDSGMRTDGIPKGLTEAQRVYYKQLIGTVYRNWKEVEDELKYANPQLTKRYAKL